MTNSDEFFPETLPTEEGFPAVDLKVVPQPVMTILVPDSKLLENLQKLIEL